MRGRRGPPVDYIIKRLGEIEQYAERVDSQIHILRYDPDLNAYKIRVETITTVRGFYDDIVSRHQASFRYVPDRFAKPPDEIGRVLALGENGQEPVFANEVIGAEGYFRTWPIEIPAGEVRHVLARYTVYVAVGEPFSSSPMRFSERITATLSNSIDEGGLKPLVEIVQGQQPRKAQLDVEGKILICDEKNADPGVDVYCCKIHAPT